MAHQWRGVLEEYRDVLDISDATPVITLGEGGTPLIRSASLSERTGADVYLKFEGMNPTGSFKDRGMTMAVSKAIEAGAQAVLCASTGNTSASAAAYAAAAGVRAAVLLPAGKIAPGKLSQAIIHGAQIVQIDGNFDDCLQISQELAAKYPVHLVNSVNPDRLQGQKTASFEVIDVLGDAPDIQLMPVGNAGNYSSYALGYREAVGYGWASKLPVMYGFQAAGAAPLVHGAPVPNPETIATAIRIGNPASWDLAVAARDETGGQFFAIDDRAILEAQRLLAASSGVFVEPASAIGIAGMLAHPELVPAGAKVVVVVTGHGLKDPQWALRTPDGAEVQLPETVAADVDAVSAAFAFDEVK